MLTMRIENTGKGTNESAHYQYTVWVNQKVIERGEISGHNRDDGWASLVQSIAQRHLTPRAADGALCTCESSTEYQKDGVWLCGFCHQHRR